MDARRRAVLRNVVATFAPSDARVERVTEYASLAIDGLTPKRRVELEELLDLLALPMRGSEATRTGVLKLFANAPIAKLRSGFAALKRLTLFLCYAESEPGSENPTWRRIGYPGPRDDHGAKDPPLPLATARDGERVAADVVVIGSGAGGGVVASAFARAGKRVVVLEAGRAFDASAMAQREIGMKDLYLDGGLTATDDLSVAILAGSTLGGGTTVNWCTSFRLPERIAAEWEAECGIAGLGAELRPHYENLERALGIVPLQHHNANNGTIIDGCKALGVHSGEMPRNAPDDCGDGCGYCGLGCAYGKKRSTARAFLPDVARSGGAIYVNARAERVVTRGARADRLVVTQGAGTGDVRRFEIVADTFVVCGGSLRTPGILARSGIAHPLLGKRLFLHPVSALVALFDRPIEAWNGPMQSAYSDAYNYRAGNYGPKIEVAPSHPGIGGISLPWVDRVKHAALMARFRYAASLIAVTRDRDPGRIELDDEAQIRYRVSPHDGENLLAAIAGMADIAFAAGAARVTTLHNAPIEIACDEWTPARRSAFVERLGRIGYGSNRQVFFSAHQMGTAALGADPQKSVVDPTGAVWGYENLLVADASLFPQASGVNPMLTILAMAARVAQAHGGDVRMREGAEVTAAS